MIGLKPVDPADARTFFGHFMTAYRDRHDRLSRAEVRRERAMIIFRNRKVSEPHEGLAARMALVSQWADPEETANEVIDTPLVETAKSHYDVTNTVAQLIGEPVLTMSGVTLEELKQPDFKFPAYGFSVSLGNLDGKVSYLHAVPGAQWKEMMGLPTDADILRFQFAVETDGATTTTFDAAGHSETSHAGVSIPVYTGRVSLNPNTDLYYGTRQAGPVDEVIFGEQYVSDVLNLLNRRSMEAAVA
jgi:hypothetical protein